MTVHLKQFRERRRIEREDLFSVSYGRMWKVESIIWNIVLVKLGSRVTIHHVVLGSPSNIPTTRRLDLNILFRLLHRLLYRVFPDTWQFNAVNATPHGVRNSARQVRKALRLHQSRINRNR
jgi:hypothetical protein